MVQIRCKGLPDRIFLDYCFALRKVSSSHNVLFIINDRADIALASCADGLHIGQKDIPSHLARKILGKEKIIGLSVTNKREFNSAKCDKNIDYVGAGPIFKTDTKPDAKIAGLGLIKEVLKEKRSPPLFAIGGISVENAVKLLDLGVKGIAVSSAVFGAKDPIKAVRRLRKILHDSD